jgi:hypothetical protein
VLGVSVASFQSDGQFSSRSLMRSLKPLERDLDSLTVCARLSLDYFRGVYNSVLSYATRNYDNALNFGQSVKQSKLQSWTDT